MTRRKNKGVVDKKVIFGIGFIIFGVYILLFHQLISPNSTLENIGFYTLAGILAIIPLLYLILPIKNNFNQDFLKQGSLIISLFLIISTLVLFCYTYTQKTMINQEFENQFNEKSDYKYNLTKVNYLIIPLISIIAFLLTAYFNTKSMKKVAKGTIYLHSFMLYFIQMIYSVIAIGFIYIRI